MDDSEKAKAAKAKLEAARKAADDAEVVSSEAAEALGDAAEALDGTKDALTEAADAPQETDAEIDADGGLTDAADDAAPDGEIADAESADASNAADAETADGETADGETTDGEGVAGEDAQTDQERRDADKEEQGGQEQDEPETTEPAQEPEEEAPGRPLSAVVLQWLAILFVGGAAALWAGPKIAPNLPEWAAPVAAFLTPGGNQTLEAVDAVRVEAEAKLSAAEAKVAELETALAAAAEERAAASAALAARLDEVEAALAAPENTDQAAIEEAVGGVAGRVTTLEAAIEGVKAEVLALEGFTGENAAPSAETLERVAAFGAAVEGLRAEIGVLSEKAAVIDSLAASSDLAALVARVDALEGGEAATAEAASDAAQIRRRANLDAALTDIGRALNAGEAYAGPLSTAENLSGEPAPGALSSLASAGAPSVERLSKTFPNAAQNAYAAALKAEAGDNIGDRVLAAVQGRIGGRPAFETEGDDAGAVLSRIEARLNEGALEAALAEAEALPDAARSAMSGWIGALADAQGARSAFASWRDALTAN